MNIKIEVFFFGFVLPIFSETKRRTRKEQLGQRINLRAAWRGEPEGTCELRSQPLLMMSESDGSSSMRLEFRFGNVGNETITGLMPIKWKWKLMSGA